ncbi:MAG: 3-beta hydroxysteroid dehydrogenase [Dehalococcoidia bacterium]|nr:3-beta hydroxysteroid dehydrogenase [Dehalococcoidia bacterium]|tara:strand:+ start:487 stop:1479 length:993 start_codon:yes stop_codon:yes gene_type:complete
MKKLLITGGAGLVGSFIARQALKDSIVHQVVILDHFGRYVDSLREEFFDYRKHRFADFADRVFVERGDASHFGVLRHCLEKHEPEYIIHLAALPLAKLPNLNVEEAREGSVDSTAYMLECISEMSRRNGYMPSRIVYASSSMVYGDFQSEIATEDHRTNPKEIYGTMKLAGEVLMNGLGQFFSIPYSIVRPSAVYGPTDMNRRVSQIFLEKAALKQKINVQGATEKLDFTYVKDVANGFLLCATQDGALGETFNITHGKANTLLDYVECLSKHFPDIDVEVTERDAFRPRRGTLSIEKARKAIGYEPQYTLQEGVDEYVSFFRENHPLMK